MGDDTSELPPAGWYADPTGASGSRFWDGTAWTHQVKPAAESVEVVARETTTANATGTPLEVAVHDMQTTHAAATRQLKVCRKGSRQATDAYNARVSQAAKLVDRVQEREPVAQLRGLNNKLELTTVTLSVGGVTRDLHTQVTTQVDTEGNLAISSRSTFTRMGLGTLLAGPFGLVAGASARKSSRVDERGLYLLIDGGDWAHVEPVDPSQGQAARSFAQQVVVAARGADAARARRAQELAAARANLKQLADDRSGIEAAAHDFERERQAAQLQLASTAERVQQLLQEADPSSKEARRASKALGKAAELPTRVAADLNLPSKLATVDQTSVLASGQTGREELLALIKRLPGTAQVLASRQFDSVAKQLEDGERPLLVAAARRGRSPVAIAITTTRLLSGVGQEVETLNRADIVNASVSNAFTGGKLVLRLTDGTDVEVTGIAPVASISEVERILNSPVQPQEPEPAEDEPSEDVLADAAVVAHDALAAEKPDPSQADPIALLRQLSELHASGVLTDEEFASKKQEVLARM